jgi:RNA polymerase sigma-70 factor (ECF subfamily)
MPRVTEVALAAPREPFAPEQTDLAALRLGEAEALAEVYRAHAPRLLRLCSRLLGSVPDAEDVLHDVFVALPSLLRHYEERGQFDAWLRAVTVRSAQGRLRAGRRRERLATYDLPVERVRGPDRSPWDAMDLVTAIDAMPDTLRPVFVLKQLEGYSHDEIAGLLRISAGASRVRLLRALQHLRQHLEPPSR